MSTPEPSRPSRRALLRAGSAAALLGAAAPLARGARRTPDHPETLRVGLIGCGGRGTGAALEALRADPQAKLVALGDVFADHLERSLATLRAQADVASRVEVVPELCCVGFDAFRQVIDECDVVLLASTPHFRPQHLEYAVERGRHLFVEKPVAVDVPGLRRVRAACERAREQSLSLVAGLCYRYEEKKRETVRRVHDGAIGEVVALQTSYNTGGLWHRGRQEGWSDMEWQIRNWLYFNWLSGDHITEQHIHSLDKLAWVMGGFPLECTASGGRSVRTEEHYGDVYDHFNTVFEWPGGVRGFSSCRQWSGASADVSDHVFGTRGTARLMGHRIEGQDPWRWRGEGPDDMYQNEQDALFASIRSGERRDDSEHMIGSTMMAIMARQSAYTGQRLTWEQAWSSEQDLTPPAYEWGPLPVAEVPRPGITRFV